MTGRWFKWYIQPAQQARGPEFKSSTPTAPQPKNKQTNKQNLNVFLGTGGSRL
jgi:hypothetical protein